MGKGLATAIFGAALSACSPNPTPAAAPPPAAVDNAVDASATSARPSGVALGALNPCVFTPAEIGTALTGQYAAGVRVVPIPGAPRRDCTYDEQGGQGQLRVNVTWLEPSSAATSKAMMLNMLAGGIAPMPGDPDGAIFQDQTELGTYALHYARGNLLYEVRLMTFRGGAAAAKAKLLKLRRP